MKDHVARTVSRCFRQLRLLKGCIKSLPFEAARAAVAAFVTSQVPSSHRKSIAGTVCWSARLSASWIACNPTLTPLLGCCATEENVITLHRSFVMFYTGSQFLFELSLRSAYWSTSRFMGPRLGICATIVRRRIRPLRVYDFDRRINATFL